MDYINLSPQKRNSITAYTDRVSAGHSFERELARRLSKDSIKSFPYGFDYLPSEIKAVIRVQNDKFSHFVRFLPDLVAVPLRNQAIPFFVEAKSTISKTNYFSINKAAYECQYKLNHFLGLEVLYIFPPSHPEGDYLAEWIQYLPRTFACEVNNPRQLQNTNGSRRPFILLVKTKLRTLNVIVSELLGSNRNLHDVVKKTFNRHEYENKLYGFK